MEISLSPSRASLHAHAQKLPKKFPLSGRDLPASAAAFDLDRREPGAFLGTTAKSFVKEDKGVAFESKKAVDVAFDPMHARTERYALQEVAQRLLPNSRTAKCLHYRKKDRAVSILKSVAHGTTSYDGLQTCASVWTCAVCSAKISERRRVELLEAMNIIKAEGGFVSMLTLTTPHTRRDNLKELLSQQARALAIFNADRKVRDIMRDILGSIGQIRALEVTNGRKSDDHNGWHPHYHVIVMHAFKRYLLPIQKMLYERWVHACEKAGLGTPSELHGLKLNDGEKAAEYVTKFGLESDATSDDDKKKWGLDREMTSGHTKKSRKGETPFDLLRALRDDPTDTHAGMLFKEFAEAFHGKRQLFWSPGLRAKCRLPEEEKNSDAANAALEAQRQEGAQIEVGTLTTDQWSDVRKANGRGILLQIAAVGGWPACLEYFETLRNKAATKKAALAVEAKDSKIRNAENADIAVKEMVRNMKNRNRS